MSLAERSAEEHDVSTDDLSNQDIVLFALFELGGQTQRVHTERIAAKAFERARSRFSWRLPEFQEYPDKDVARVALMDARKAKNGALVEGRSGESAEGKDPDGWTFTAAGHAWLRSRLSGLRVTLGQPPMKLREKDRQMVSRLKAQTLYDRYRTGVMVHDDKFLFTDMLQVSPDAPRTTIQGKFETLRTRLQHIDDREIDGFLGACDAMFGILLRGETQ